MRAVVGRCLHRGGGVAAQTLISSNPSLRLLEIADNQGSALIFDANTKDGLNNPPNPRDFAA